MKDREDFASKQPDINQQEFTSQIEEVDFSNPNPTILEQADPPANKKFLDKFAKKASRSFEAIAFGGVAVGVLGFALYGLAEFRENRVRNRDPRYEPVNRNEGLKGLETYYKPEGATTIFDLKEVISLRYQLSRDSFREYAKYELITDWGRETEEFIFQQRYEFAIEGSEILKKYHGVDGININRDELSVEYPELGKFDLKDTYDVVLLDAVINSKLKSGIALDDEEEYLATTEFEDLRWLIEARLPIEIRENTFAYPQDGVLQNMSRLYRKTQELGYEMPDKIVFRPYAAKDSAGGYHIDGQHYLNEFANSAAIVHEEAHNQQSVNERFSQNEYDKVVSGAVSSMLNSGDNETFLPFTYVNVFATRNEREDYAYTIEKYFAEGVEFRRILNELRATDNPAYVVWKAKYDFAKAYWGGQEFVKDGEVFEPVVGDWFEISIYKYQDVALRTDEGYDSGLLDGDVVEILSSEVRNFSADDGTVLENYKVRLISASGGTEGWIWEGYLGNIKRHSGADEFNNID